MSNDADREQRCACAEIPGIHTVGDHELCCAADGFELPHALGVIVQIVRAEITTYRDNGQTVAYVTWQDRRGKQSTTTGDPNNAHMAALLVRARREGVEILSDTVGR